MFPQKAKTIAEIDPKTYPLGEQIEHDGNGTSLALVALSHTPIERRLYAAMLAAANGSAGEASQADTASNLFTARSVKHRLPFQEEWRAYCAGEYPAPPSGRTGIFRVGER